MPVCPNGSEPAPGAPTFFTFDGTDLASLAPGVAPFIALPLLDVPTTPQYTADFCSVGPPEDLGTAADFALLGTGIIGIASGAFHRVGNLVKAQKWSELCVCKAANTTTDVAPDSYCMDTITGGRGNGILVGQVPANATDMAVTFSAWTGGTDPMDAANAPTLSLYNSAAADSHGFPTGANYANLRVDTIPGTVHFTPNVYTGATPEDTTTPPLWLWIGGSAHPTVGECFTVSFTYTVPGVGTTTVPPPDPVPTPTGYPSSGPCDMPSLSDLCKAIAAIDTRLRWVADQLVPPELTPGDSAEPVPVDPVDGTSAPVDKPAAAVGVIITASSIPPYVARYGHAPQFFPALGHCAMLTLAGPLPSVLIKHSPMVLTPLPPQVKSLQLDLAEGVTATFTWLYNPK
jgi:hypothetical protein